MRFLALLFLLLLSPALAFGGSVDCKDRRVEIGGHVFSFPRNAGHLYTDTGGSWPCGVLRRSKFLNYFPKRFFGKSGRIGEEGFAFRLSISASRRGEASDTYVHNDVAARLREEHTKLSSLPREHGYFRFQDGLNQFFFISTKLRTPAGHPVVFQCHHARVDKPNLTCRTSIYWKDGIGAYISDFSTTFIPDSEWDALYHEFLRYMDDVEISKN